MEATSARERAHRNQVGDKGRINTYAGETFPQ